MEAFPSILNWDVYRYISGAGTFCYIRVISLILGSEAVCRLDTYRHTISLSIPQHKIVSLVAFSSQ